MFNKAPTTTNILTYAMTTGLLEKKVRKALIKMCGQKQRDGITPSHNASTAQFILSEPYNDLIGDIVQSVALKVLEGEIVIGIANTISNPKARIIYEDGEAFGVVLIRKKQPSVEYVSLITPKTFYKAIYQTLSSYKNIGNIDYVKGQLTDSENGHKSTANDYLSNMIDNAPTLKDDIIDRADFNDFFNWLQGHGVRQKTVEKMGNIIEGMLDGLNYEKISKKYNYTVTSIKQTTYKMRKMWAEYKIEFPHKTIKRDNAMKYGIKTKSFNCAPQGRTFTTLEKGVYITE